MARDSRLTPDFVHSQPRFQQQPYRRGGGGSTNGSQTPSGNANYVISEAEPAPFEGLQWYKPSTDELQLYENGAFTSLRGGGTPGSGNYVISSTEPGSPFEGLQWYDPTNDTLEIYEGGNFVNLRSGGGGTPTPSTDYVISSTEPANPTIGMLWFNTNLNELRVYKLVDGTASFVLVGEGDGDGTDYVISETEPTTTKQGLLWFKPSIDELRIYDAPNAPGAGAEFRLIWPQLDTTTTPAANSIGDLIATSTALPTTGEISGNAEITGITWTLSSTPSGATLDSDSRVVLPLKSDKSELNGYVAVCEIDGQVYSRMRFGSPLGSGFGLPGLPIRLEDGVVLWVGFRVDRASPAADHTRGLRVFLGNYGIALTNAPNPNTTIKIYESISGGGGSVVSGGGSFSDRFTATAGTDGAVDANGILGWRYGGGSQWTIDTNTAQVDVLANLISGNSEITTDDQNFTNDVHAQGTGTRMVLDRQRGICISNDDGATWGAFQRPFATAFVPAAAAKYMGFRVYNTPGSDEVFLIYGRPFANDQTGSIAQESGHIFRFYQTAQIQIGELNPSARTITNWQKLTSNTVLFDQPSTNFCSFYYDIPFAHLMVLSTDASVVYSYDLPNGGHTATFRTNWSSSGLPDRKSFNIVGEVNSLTSGILLRAGDRLATVDRNIPSTVSQYLALPGISDTLVNYGSILRNPDNPSQLFLIKNSLSIPQSSLETATYSEAGFGSITGYTDAVHLSPSAIEGINCLSTPGADRGLYVGNSLRYDVGVAEQSDRIYPYVSGSPKPLVGITQASVPSGGSVSLQYKGVVSGLSGLSVGTTYFYQGQPIGTVIAPDKIRLRYLD